MFIVIEELNKIKEEKVIRLEVKTDLKIKKN